MQILKKIDIDALSDNRAANYWAIGSILVLGGVLSMVALSSWLGADPTQGFETSVPGRDGLPPDFGVLADAADLSGVFESFDGVSTDLPGEWTGFRGANHDNVRAADGSLASSWSADGPKVEWHVEIGEGYAAPAVLNGRVYLLDYDSENRADALRVFSLADGKEIWRRSYAIKIKRNHGMSRTIPAVTEDYIVTVGPKCHVVCLDTDTGDFRWGIDLQYEYGTDEPLWYTGQCPIIKDGLAIIAPAGDDTLMMAVDCETGIPRWKTPNPRGWKMSHSSIIPMTLLGKKMFVYCALGGIVGVSAEEEDAGELLWEKVWNAKVVAPSPVQVNDDHIFMAVGYGKGNLMLELSEQGGTYSAEVVYERPPAEGLTCEQQTPIFYDGLLYSIMPKDAGALKGQFVCYTPEGELVWSSGQDNRFGLGPFLLADEKFYILNDDGVMTMLDGRTQGYTQLAQAPVLHGHDAWGPLALAGSRMLVRDMDTMACVNLGSGD